MEEYRSPQLSQRELNSLLQARVIYVATVRKNDTQSKAAPLWFTTTCAGRILLQSGPDTWHVRRIRRGSPVIVWVGNKRGVAFIAKAEIIDDPKLVGQIIKDFPRKYLMAWLGLHRPSKSSFQRGTRVAIQISPVHMLPPGFSSQPGAPAPSIADFR
jgi:general stress protein 26